MGNPDDLEKLFSGTKSIIGRLNRMESQLRSVTAESAGEIDAVAYLRESLRPVKYIPAAGGWAAPYRTIAHLVSMVLEGDFDGDLLELGGGTSTIWLGLAAKMIGNTKIISVDHDANYARRTADFIRRHELEDHVEVVLAPLVPVAIDGQEHSWYDLEKLPLRDSSVGCLFVDGPPADGGRYARYPAYPLLAPYLTGRAWVLLDDADRDDEREIAERWRASSPDLGQVGQVARTSIMRRGE